jgi:flagellar basal-body rod protein FlgC
MEINGPRPRSPFSGLRTAASGLTAQRRRLEVVAENMANIESFNADGTPYRRKIVQLQAMVPTEVGEVAESSKDDGVRRARNAQDAGDFDDAIEAAANLTVGGVQVVGITEDDSEGARVYDPGHEFADENGYVTMPNVNITREYADMMDAQGLYEANASVFQAIKSMLRRATQL